MRKNALALLALLISFFSFSQYQTPPQNASEIYHALQRLNKVGKVLYVAAHPDDENTRVISWLEKERHVETAYLSLTRGDGGQNLIGPEKGDLLGVIRTHELLNARKVDGGQQFFTRASDFGYSKSPEETFQHWDKQEVLADVVWVIRKYQPEVIITRFPPTAEAGHGHHTASAILAEEAFDLAADPNAFPDQLNEVKPWQAKRLAWNSYTWRRDPKLVEQDVKMELGQYDPLTGKNTGELASLARSQHRCQGFGRAMQRGSFDEYFKYLKGSDFSNDILEGIETNWENLPGGKAASIALNKIVGTYEFLNPSKSVTGLLQLTELINGMPDFPSKREKLELINELVLACMGVNIDAYSSQKQVFLGDKINADIDVINRSSVACMLQSISVQGQDTTAFSVLKRNDKVSMEWSFDVVENTPYSAPFWLMNGKENDLYTWPNANLRGQARAPYLWMADFVFQVQGYTVKVQRPLLHKRIEPDFGEVYAEIALLPKIYFKVNSPTKLVKSGVKSTLEIELVAKKDDAKGSLIVVGENVELLSAAKRNFTLKANDSKVISVDFIAKEDTKPSISFSFISDEKTYSWAVTEVDYEHFPKQYVLSEAKVQLQPISLKLPELKVAYIPGAGDEMPKYLEQAGVNVTVIEASDVLGTNLRSFDAVMAGIRLYNVEENMPEIAKHVLAYVKAGGTYIVQYQTRNFLSEVKAKLGPYPFEISRGRVTEEIAEVKVLQPNHKIFNSPNKLTSGDWNNWVQERGLYFADEWDKKYTPLLEMNDEGEKPLKGSLLYASYGKGHYFYSGVSFFRQLPAGVPGSYKLLINMLSIGKK